MIYSTRRFAKISSRHFILGGARRRYLLSFVFGTLIISYSLPPAHSDLNFHTSMSQTQEVIRSHFFDIEKTSFTPVSQDFGSPHFVSVIRENLFLAVLNKNGVDTELAIIDTGNNPKMNVIAGLRIQDYFNSKKVIVTDLEDVEFSQGSNNKGNTYLAFGIESFPTERYPTGFRTQIVLGLTIDFILSRITKVDRIFETEPIPNESGVPLALSQVGGRIALSGKIDFKKPSFFLSVGDYSYSYAQKAKLASKIQKSLGIVLYINGVSSSVYSTGHRNPQGLIYAKSGSQFQLIETEHGPRGGDELNFLKRGQDYGWPNSSYGTAYDTVQRYSKAKTEGFITSGVLPTFSWVPSIATSDLIQIDGLRFSKWWVNTSSKGLGDLMVATLKDKSLHRIRIDSGAVRNTERIQIGHRIRTISQTNSGTIVLGTDNGPLITLTPFSQWDLSTENYIPLRAYSTMDLSDSNWNRGVGKSTSEFLISSVDKNYDQIKVGGRVIFGESDSRFITNLTLEGAILRVAFSGEPINSSVGGFPNRIKFLP